MVVGMSREDFVKVAQSRPSCLPFKRSYNSSESYAPRMRVKPDRLLECPVEGDRGGDIHVFELIRQCLIAAARIYTGVALRFLDKSPPDLAEVRNALAGIANATRRRRPGRKSWTSTRRSWR